MALSDADVQKQVKTSEIPMKIEQNIGENEKIEIFTISKDIRDFFHLTILSCDLKVIKFEKHHRISSNLINIKIFLRSSWKKNKVIHLQVIGFYQILMRQIKFLIICSF